MSLVLAFDLELPGPLMSSQVIAIGASVVDENFQQKEALFLPCYFPDSTQFDTDTWDEFWSKHEDKLELMTYEGPLSKCERMHEVIREFQAFRAKWETMDPDLKLVSDNVVFDGTHVNELIRKYLPETKPLLYRASDGKRGYVEDTHSMQKGFLMAVDPTFNKKRGFTKRIQELYEVPEFDIVHDHLPHHDAYTIACEYQTLIAIREGRIERRS